MIFTGPGPWPACAVAWPRPSIEITPGGSVRHSTTVVKTSLVPSL
ncbi:MAG: hypothetical protein ABI641_11430 [Caldimonas sp.]